MKLKRIKALALLLLALAFAPAAVAQDAQKELNEQMWEAARRGDAAAVKALLDKGADVNAKFRYGATALFKAAERGHVEVVKLLLARGADAAVKDTFYGATAMTWALSNDHSEVVRALLEKDSSGAGEVLMTAVRKGDAALTRIALDSGGAKPETLTLALAAASGDEKGAEIAEMLRKAGAKPPPEIDAATLESYAGKYKAESGTEISITHKDGKLFAGTSSQPPLALAPTDTTNFRPTAFDGLTVTFNLEGGKVASVTFKQGANTTVFKKVVSSQ